MPPCGEGIYIRWQHLIFFYLCTWLSCIKKIGQSCVCWAVGPALQNNSSNCLVLILHRQLGNLMVLAAAEAAVGLTAIAVGAGAGLGGSMLG